MDYSSEKDDLETLERTIPLDCTFTYFPKEPECVIERRFNVCYTCKEGRHSFATGEAMGDLFGVGHNVVLFLVLVIIVTSISGTIANILAIKVIRSRPNSSFTTLVTVLAVVDIGCCISSILSSICKTIRTHGWINTGNKSYLYFALYSLFSFGVCRQLSMYFTIVIAFGRYLAVSSPLKYRRWDNPKSTKLQIVFLTLLILCVAWPSFSWFEIVRNNLCLEDLEPEPSYCQFEYVVQLADVEAVNLILIVFSMLGWVIIEILPMPLLTVMTFISIKMVYYVRKRRNQICGPASDELSPFKMFLPVLTFFMISYCFMAADLVINFVEGSVLVEFEMLALLTAVVNASVNFFLYYSSSYRFREDTAKILGPRFGRSKNIYSVSFECNRTDTDAV